MQTMLTLATAEPEVSLSAPETKNFLATILPAHDADRFARVVDASRIRRRRALLPYDGLRRLATLEARNALWAAHAPAMGERAARSALAAAGCEARDVGVLVVTSSTGLAVPTLDQHLATLLGLRPEVRSLFLSGLGCAGAVRAIGLAVDLLRASLPGGRALVVSVELCSPWLQVVEPSPEDVLSSIVFGDGAAAAVVGDDAGGRGIEVIACHSEIWPNTVHARGAILTQSGFRHFASPSLPRLLRAHLGRSAGGFLAKNGVSPADLRFYAVNPSDHRVLETAAAILSIPEDLMRPAWDAWREHGNTLSAGPLYVIDALSSAPPAPGSLGLAVVLGPGLTCDLALLRWRGGWRC
jgi:alkylresorcinol/alkylpyrone synthase